MSTVSKYIKVHPDVLAEWVYDSENYNDSDYTVVVDSLNDRRSFALSYGADVSAAARDNNRNGRQLFQLDSVTNKFGVADPAQRAYIQHEDHASPPPQRFDRLRLYFPINYVFEDVAGFYVAVSAYDYDNRKLYGLANYYIDAAEALQVAEVKFLTPPWQFQEGLWGKTVDLLVPSLYDTSRQRTSSRPTPGTLNYTLTGGLNSIGLSQTAPVIIDFRFIEKRESLLGKLVYTSVPSQRASVPQAPEYQSLGVAVEHAADGDYYEIYGTFNGNTADFDDFMYALAESGQRNTVLFTVTVFEEGMAQDPVTFRLSDSYNKRIPFCPVLKFTNTTATISVAMSILNDVDGSSEVRNAEIGLFANDVAKFGRKRISINLSNAVKPKVYVARPDQVILGSGALAGGARRVQVQRQTQIKFKPLPQLSSDYNIVASDINASRAGDTYFGKGFLRITLHPFDNVLRFHLAREVSAQAYVPFTLDGADDVMILAFRTAGRNIDVDMYRESPELDPRNGVYIYKLKESDVQALRAMVAENDNFYLTLNNTVVYHGKYGLSGMDISSASATKGPKPVKEPIAQTALEQQIVREVQTPASITAAAISPPLVAAPPQAATATNSTGTGASTASGAGTGTGSGAGAGTGTGTGTGSGAGTSADDSYAPYYGGGFAAGGGKGSVSTTRGGLGPAQVDYALIN